MGSIIEFNDTLQLTTAEGFPVDLFNLARHRADPITLCEVKGMEFEFRNKVGPRFFHLDPVRVYWYHNIEGKWLAWGQIVIHQQTISRNPGRSQHQGAINVSSAEQWITSGKYTVLKIYEPHYQELFTRQDLPPQLSYFAAT